MIQSVHSFRHVQLFATPWTIACQASLSITNSQSLPKLMSIESVMPSNHLILCHPLLLLPSIFPRIRVFQMSQLFASGGLPWLGVFIKLQAQRLFYSNSIQTWWILLDLIFNSIQTWWILLDLIFVSVDLVPVAWLNFCTPELDFPGGSVVKNPRAKERDARDVGLIPGLGRSSEVGNGSPLQCCFLENSMDRESWRAAVHGVTKSWTWLNTHTHTHTHMTLDFHLFLRELKQVLLNMRNES